MLIGKNKRKVGKKALCLIFAFLLSINSFAAVVSDNDGAAFVTKAEFEALKKDFADQIENYERSLDEKVDGAIAAYLAGIRLSKVEVVQTGFELEGGKNKQINFLGHSNNGWNFSNEIYGRDRINLVAIGTYQTAPSYYVYDQYDTWVWHGIFDHTTDTNNTYFILDKDNIFQKVYWNVKLECNRNDLIYSTTNAWDGLIWSQSETILATPSSMLKTDSAFVDDANSKYKGYGLGRAEHDDSTGTWKPRAAGDPYVNGYGRHLFQNNGGPWTKGSDPTRELNPYWVLYTNEEEKEAEHFTRNCSVSMTGSTVEYGLHFCFQPDLALRGTRKKWNEIENVDEARDSNVDYAVTRDIQYSGGYWTRLALDTAKTPRTRTIKGRGVKVHEEKDSSGNSTIFPSNIYYKTLKEQWDELIPYTGGFPVFKAPETGSIRWKVKLTSNNITVNFTKSQHATMPSTTDAGLVTFDYRDIETSSMTKDVKNASLTKDKTYEFKIELEKNDIIYLNCDLTEGTAGLISDGDAIWESA